jgi:XTP/dITP diphosphohydrolase
MKKVLFGTRNKARLAYLQEILKDLPIEIISLNDLEIDHTVEEIGRMPINNSIKKALEYFRQANMPTFSIDSGLFIEKFPKDKQPGVFVRRIKADQRDATDEEMLDYYITELEKCGGSSPAVWMNALTMVISEEKIFSTVYERETFLTSQICDSYTPDEPLNSLQFDAVSMKYVAEMSLSEKKESQKGMAKHIEAFVREHLNEM